MEMTLGLAVMDPSEDTRAQEVADAIRKEQERIERTAAEFAGTAEQQAPKESNSTWSWSGVVGGVRLAMRAAANSLVVGLAAGVVIELVGISTTGVSPTVAVAIAKTIAAAATVAMNRGRSSSTIANGEASTASPAPMGTAAMNANTTTTSSGREAELIDMPRTPEVAKQTGYLVMVGGGPVPKEAYEEFERRAGEKKARVVVIPSASKTAKRTSPPREFYNGRGEIASLHLLHLTREEANDPALLKVLQEATGVWISGGDQDRLMELYRGTLVEKELRALLDRGGIIGGTSAGAAAMSNVMPNGDRTVGTGFGFFVEDGVVDQHVNTRGRTRRLLIAIQEQSREHFGVGIHERTALVVDREKGTAKVVGDSGVELCTQDDNGKCTVKTLVPGEEIDLRKHSVSMNRVARRR